MKYKGYNIVKRRVPFFGSGKFGFWCVRLDRWVWFETIAGLRAGVDLELMVTS